MRIKCGDGTLVGDLNAAAVLADTDQKPYAAALYRRAAEHIEKLERILRVEGYNEEQIKAGTPYVEVMGG